MPRKYILTLIMVTIILFGGIFLLIKLISGGSKTSQSGQSVKSSATQKVNKLSPDASEVSYTMYGRIVGEEDRRAIRIIVTTNERRIEILQGYNETVISSQRFDNNDSAFQAFLLALEAGGFTTHDTSIKTDERDICPLGTRNVYYTKYKDSKTVRSWLTSCGAKGASFRGSSDVVDTLFKDQISNYDDLTNDVVL